MQQGHNIENSIIPATFTALTVKFYTLQLLSAPLFPCAFSSAADKRPVRTDISIAQKTCVFRPVDISVAAAKRSKLIYQSVYSLSHAKKPLHPARYSGLYTIMITKATKKRKMQFTVIRDKNVQILPLFSRAIRRPCRNE